MNRNDEIIIVRRGDGEDEKKKGGVWKIAHADFMTAMMAFFLIMWLVNATDEEIKKSIANYFNPINLVASPTDIRGLADPDPDSEPPASGENEGQRTGERPLGTDVPGNAGSALGGGNVEEGNENTMASAGILTETDNAAFNDPFAELSSAAADIDPENPVSVDVPQSTLGAEGQTRRSEDTRDPFDPTYWQTARTREAQTLRPGREPTSDVPPPFATLDATDAEPRGDLTEPSPSDTEVVDGARTPPARPRGNSQNVASLGPRSTVAEAILAELGPRPEPLGEEESAQGDVQSPAEARAEAAQSAREALAEALAGTSADVRLDGGGEDSVLVSLTDDGAFSMFNIGSSTPTPEADALFARVGSVLAERSGQVVVRGHTDARPFRGGRSDNWVLSFERAHATKEALTEGGIAEERFVRVEGLADREPANADDPLSDENRRIEILYVPSVESANDDPADGSAADETAANNGNDGSASAADVAVEDAAAGDADDDGEVTP